MRNAARRRCSYGVATYTATGLLSEIRRYGTVNLYTDYSYDPADHRPLDVTTTKQSGSTFTELRDTAYGYDDAGNVRSIISSSDTAATDAQCFDYSPLQTLTEAWTPDSGDCSTAPTVATLGGPAPYWNSYEVDPATGNRLSTTSRTPTDSTTDTYAYPAGAAAQPHAVQSVTSTGGATGTKAFAYDANGSTTSRPGQSLGYDVQGRLSSLTMSAGTQQNVYDASGQLLLQVDPTAGATLYLGDTQLRQAAGSSSVSGQRTYSIGGVAFAERTTGSGAAAVTWLASDVQGTISDQVNSSTGARSTMRLDPFGQPRGGSAAAWSDGRGFLNAPVNAATGLSQLGVRFYDAGLGRFLSVDPVLSPFDPQQNDGYAYAHNSPVTQADPSGAFGGPAWDALTGGGGWHPPMLPPVSTGSASGGSSGHPGPQPKAQGPSAQQPAAPQKAVQPEIQWWNPTTWNDEIWHNVGAGLTIAGGAALAVVGVLCIVGTLGACAPAEIGAGAIIALGVGELAAPVVAATAGAAVSGAAIAGGAAAIGYGASNLSTDNRVLNRDGGGLGGDPSAVSSQAGSAAAEDVGSAGPTGVDDVLRGLPKGNQDFVRTVPNEESVNDLFAELSKGGNPMTWKNYDGRVVERGDGVQVGIRGYSKSGGSALDIRMPDGNLYRIHVEE